MSVGQKGVSGNGGLNDVDLTVDVTGVLPVANGGTGSSTASGARTNLSAAASGANTDITSVYLNNTGLKVKDTNASHGLSLVPSSDITADRTLSINTGDADATLYANHAAFFAYLGTTDSNVTGNGTGFTLGSGNALTEVFDYGGDFNTNGTFTARHTRAHRFEAAMHVVGNTIASNYLLSLVTSNRTYYLTANVKPGGAENIGVSGSALVDMDAGDTAQIVISVGGEAANTSDVYGNASTPHTYFSGNLVP